MPDQTLHSAIVLVTSSFPMQADGSEAAGSFVSDLAEELAKHVPVRVVAPGTKNCREWWAEDVEVFRYASPAKPLSTLRLWSPCDLLRTIQVLRAGQQATNDAVAAGPVSSILALWALPGGHWARRAAKRFGMHYSVWTLGSDIWSLGRIPIVRQYLRRILKDARQCYSDGYQLAEDTKRIAGRDVEFLPSTRNIGVTNPPASRREPPYRLLFLGRWHHNKGVDLLLDALALLSDDDWSRIERVEIQGGGPMHDLVHNNVAELRSAGRPVDVGRYLKKDEAEAAIARADWVVIPSRTESIPVVFSDALKLGRPVICSPVGDLPRLLEQSDGVCADSATAPAIREVISVALRNDQRPHRDASELLRQFSLDRIASQILRHAEAAA